MQAKIQKIEQVKHRLWWQISIILFALACFYMITASTVWAAHEINGDDAGQHMGLLSIDSIPAGTSGRITLPVRLEQAQGVGTATILAYYDVSLLRVSDCITDPGNLLDSVLCNESYGEEGVVPFNIVSTSGFSGDAIAAEINFEIINTLNNPFVPKLEIRHSATDINGVEIFIAVAEVNQISSEGDILAEVLEEILQVFLPIVLK